MTFPQKHRNLRAVLMAGVLLAAGGAHAADWTPSWGASPQAAWGAENPLPMNLPQLNDQTVRQVVRLSLGGERLRVVLSNAYGREPLVIGALWVGQTLPGGAVRADTGQRVTVSGLSRIVIAPGAQVVSDPVDFEAPPLSQVSVSLYLPQRTEPSTFHWDGRQTAYIASGDVARNDIIKPVATTPSRLFVSEVLVEGSRPVVVALGDSITDGASASLDADRRWTDFLAEDLAPEGVAVINAGISGARVLSDGMGVNALARFDRDVLAPPNVRAVIVHLGINDISWPGSSFEPTAAAVSPEAVIAGYRQLIAQARVRDVRIIGATLLPFRRALEGTPIAGYYSEDKDRARQAINAWIRTSGEFDAVIDFDAALRDPKDPSRLRSDVDGGDHLHPGDAGNRAMATLARQVALSAAKHADAQPN